MVSEVKIVQKKMVGTFSGTENYPEFNLNSFSFKDRQFLSPDSDMLRLI